MRRTVLGLCCTLSGKGDDPCWHDEDVGDEKDRVTEDIADVEAVEHGEGEESGERGGYRIVCKVRRDLPRSGDF